SRSLVRSCRLALRPACPVREPRVYMITEQLKLHHGQNQPRNPVWRRGRCSPWDGAFMEPRGCNWWQSTANRTGAKGPKTSQNRCRPLRPVAARSNGNERVDGSSPSEGSAKGRKPASLISAHLANDSHLSHSSHVRSRWRQRRLNTFSRAA